MEKEEPIPFNEFFKNIQTPHQSEVVISFTREEMVYLNVISNLALLINASSNVNLLEAKMQFSGLKDLDFKKMLEQFEHKVSDAIHKHGWCPDPDCEDKK